MVKICRCPDIAKERGITDVYGEWPLHGVPDQSMKNKLLRRKKIVIEDPVSILDELDREAEQAAFEDLL